MYRQTKDNARIPVQVLNSELMLVLSLLYGTVGKKDIPNVRINMSKTIGTKQYMLVRD